MIELIINGKLYTQFEEISIIKALDTLGGGFEVIVASEDLLSFPIKLYQSAIIIVDGKPIINGYINIIDTGYDPHTHTIRIVGNDNAIDIAQSDVRSNTQYSGVLTFGLFCQKVLSDNAIFDVNVVDLSFGVVFSAEEEMSAETGTNIFEFLDKYARKKGVILNSDGNGNLIVYRNTGFSVGSILVNKKGSNSNHYILSSNGGYDMTSRYSRIIVKSQGGDDGLYGLAQNNGNEDIQAELQDGEVLKFRTKVIISETATDLKGCREQATWEINKRRADSISYSATVQGFKAPNGIVFEAGQLVTIDDDFADIQSMMLLNSVNYKQSQPDGSTCTLQFISSDAYKLQSEFPTNKVDKVATDLFYTGEDI